MVEVEAAFAGIAAGLLGAVMVAAGIAKVRQGRLRTRFGFKSLLPGWPTWLVGGLARVTPWVEVALGTLLLSGLVPLYAAVATGVLLLAFTVVLMPAVLRGRDVSCNCFGVASVNRPVSWKTIARNAALIAASALVVAVAPASTVAAPNALFLIVCGVLAALVILTISTTLRVDARLRQVSRRRPGLMEVTA